MANRIPKVSKDEFWLVVEEGTDYADVAEKCGVWETEKEALEAAAECAADAPHVIYHCQRKLAVTV